MKQKAQPFKHQKERVELLPADFENCIMYTDPLSKAINRHLRKKYIDSVSSDTYTGKRMNRIFSNGMYAFIIGPDPVCYLHNTFNQRSFEIIKEAYRLDPKAEKVIYYVDLEPIEMQVYKYTATVQEEKPNPAEELIKKILDTANAESITETLMGLLTTYAGSKDCDADKPMTRENITWTVHQLTQFFRAAQVINDKNKKPKYSAPECRNTTDQFDGLHAKIREIVSSEEKIKTALAL
jgi:predicted protein tyrosine phosphatase